MSPQLIGYLKTVAKRIVIVVGERLLQCTQRLKATLIGGTVSVMAYGRNALLRKQVTVLKRQVKRPMLRNRDRLLLGILANKLWALHQALLLVKPGTLVGWHRDLLRLIRTADQALAESNLFRSWEGCIITTNWRPDARSSAQMR